MNAFSLFLFYKMRYDTSNMNGENDMSDKTKPPKAPEYPKGSPVTSGKRTKNSNKKNHSDTSLLFRLFNFFRN